MERGISIFVKYFLLILTCFHLARCWEDTMSYSLPDFADWRSAFIEGNHTVTNYKYKRQKPYVTPQNPLPEHSLQYWFDNRHKQVFAVDWSRKYGIEGFNCNDVLAKEYSSTPPVHDETSVTVYQNVTTAECVQQCTELITNNNKCDASAKSWTGEEPVSRCVFDNIHENCYVPVPLQNRVAPYLPRMTPYQYSQNMLLLKEMDKSFREHNVNYYMCCGTLAGSYLFQDMLPWDDDLDVHVPRKDFPRMAEFLKDHPILEYFDVFDSIGCAKIALRNGTTFTQPQKFWKWPFVDLWLYDTVNDTIHAPRNARIHHSTIFPTHLRPFGDLWLPAPNRPGIFLSVTKGREVLDRCWAGHMFHTTETKLKIEYTKVTIDCIELEEYTPFVRTRWPIRDAKDNDKVLGWQELVTMQSGLHQAYFIQAENIEAYSLPETPDERNKRIMENCTSQALENRNFAREKELEVVFLQIYIRKLLTQMEENNIKPLPFDTTMMHTTVQVLKSMTKEKFFEESIPSSDMMLKLIEDKKELLSSDFMTPLPPLFTFGLESNEPEKPENVAGDVTDGRSPVEPIKIKSVKDILFQQDGGKEIKLTKEKECPKCEACPHEKECPKCETPPPKGSECPKCECAPCICEHKEEKVAECEIQQCAPCMCDEEDKTPDWLRQEMGVRKPHPATMSKSDDRPPVVAVEAVSDQIATSTFMMFQVGIFLAGVTLATVCLRHFRR